MQEINIAGRVFEIKQTAADRFVSWISPIHGARRQKARLMEALTGAYLGASRSRRQTKQWITNPGDADSDTVYDLPTLRERSRDQVRNAPIATGAIGLSVTHTVGTGLKLQSRIDREALGMDDEVADAWEEETEREFQMWANSADCDVARTLPFVDQQSLAFRQTLENGDVFVLTPRRGRGPYSLQLQLIEADRVCNKDRASDKEGLIQGVEKDAQTGAPIAYHIMNQNPDCPYVSPKDGYKWERVSAFGDRTGLRNVLHLYQTLRPGQTRGIPFLAPVIESLKMIDRYTEAELMAAVVAALFTVFLETEGGGVDFDLTTGMATETGATTSDDDIKLGNGAIVGLAKGQKISIADPKRPNTSFDPFIQAILRQIGTALGIPYEVLMRYFSSSYSASRAALLEAWRFFKTQRGWLARSFCQPVYEIWLFEAIASGRIAAPGYFRDPMIRAAYNGAVWIGDSPGYIDPQKDADTSVVLVETGFSTMDEQTTLLTGGDFQTNMRIIRKERKWLQDVGLWMPEWRREIMKTRRQATTKEEKALPADQGGEE